MNRVAAGNRPRTCSFAQAAVISLALDLDAVERIAGVIATIFQPVNNRSGTEATAEAVGKRWVFHLLAEIVELLLQFFFSVLTPFELNQTQRVSLVNGIIPDEFVKVASIRPDSTASPCQISSVAQFAQRVSV